jgi:alpha-L-rhamnosidase
MNNIAFFSTRTGMIGTKFLLPALSAIGQEGLEAAFTVATQDTMPSWGYWIKTGATTLYESWIEAGTLEQRANNAGSLNHIMLGSQVDWYSR